MESVFTWLHTVLLISFPQILEKIDPADHSAEQTRTIATEIRRLCYQSTTIPSSPLTSPAIFPYKVPLAGLVAATAVIYAYWEGYIF